MPGPQLQRHLVDADDRAVPLGNVVEQKQGCRAEMGGPALAGRAAVLPSALGTKGMAVTAGFASCSAVASVPITGRLPRRGSAGSSKSGMIGTLLRGPGPLPLSADAGRAEYSPAPPGGKACPPKQIIPQIDQPPPGRIVAGQRPGPRPETGKRTNTVVQPMIIGTVRRSQLAVATRIRLRHTVSTNP